MSKEVLSCSFGDYLEVLSIQLFMVFYLADDKGVTSPRPLLSPSGGSKVSSDLIGALLQRGEKLRDAMVLSADEDNDPDDSTALASVIERSVSEQIEHEIPINRYM